jgi:hypothetical protein
MAETLTIGDVTITVCGQDRDYEGRTCYEVSIAFPEGYSYTDKQGETQFIDRGFIHRERDLKSGCQGGTEREGMESLLSFLTAAAESYGYTMRTGRESDNSDLFPAFIVEWACENSDEIGIAAYEMEHFDAAGRVRNQRS